MALKLVPVCDLCGAMPAHAVRTEGHEPLDLCPTCALHELTRLLDSLPPDRRDAWYTRLGALADLA
jgi:hypothetical protein